MRLNGFVFMHRSIINWGWYKDIPTRLVFEHLIYTANFKDTNWKGIEIKRGQVITGRKQLADDNGLTERKVRTALEKLQSTGEITIETTNKYSLITIVNYDFYQSELSTATNKPTNNRPTDDQQPTNNRPQRNNDNKGIREEGKKDSQSSLSPSGLVPYPQSIAEVREYCIQMGLTKVDSAAFFNYYEERNWMTGGKPIENWHALVKHWNETQRENHEVVQEQQKQQEQPKPASDKAYDHWFWYVEADEKYHFGCDPISPADINEVLEKYKDFSGWRIYVEKFYEYCNNNGWKITNFPIRNWEIALRLWADVNSRIKDISDTKLETEIYNTGVDWDVYYYLTPEEETKLKELKDWRKKAAR